MASVCVSSQRGGKDAGYSTNDDHEDDDDYDAQEDMEIGAENDDSPS